MIDNCEKNMSDILHEKSVLNLKVQVDGGVEKLLKNWHEPNKK